MEIHPQAIVSPTAQIGSDVKIGPFCVIEDNTVIGDRCELHARVSIKSDTILGSDNVVHENAVLGGAAQHLNVSEMPGKLIIGSHNTIREATTVHRALEDGNATTIGDHNFLMVNAHIAHDCTMGNHIIVANNAMIAGHVSVADRAYVSGGVGIHQFCRVGRLAMVGGIAIVVKDVPPFVTVDGSSKSVVGLNLIGLKRSGFNVAEIKQLKEAYRLIYRSELTWTQILEQLEADFSVGPAAEFLPFFQGGKRGFMPARKVPAGATIRLRTDTVPAHLERKAG